MLPFQTRLPGSQGPQPWPAGCSVCPWVLGWILSLPRVADRSLRGALLSPFPTFFLPVPQDDWELGSGQVWWCGDPGIPTPASIFSDSRALRNSSWHLWSTSGHQTECHPHPLIPRPQGPVGLVGFPHPIPGKELQSGRGEVVRGNEGGQWRAVLCA